MLFLFKWMRLCHFSFSSSKIFPHLQFVRVLSMDQGTGQGINKGYSNDFSFHQSANFSKSLLSLTFWVQFSFYLCQYFLFFTLND